MEDSTKIVVNKCTGSVKIDNQLLIRAVAQHAGRDDDGEDVARVGYAVLSELLPMSAANALHRAFAQDFLETSCTPEVHLTGAQLIAWLSKQNIVRASPAVA